MAKKESPKINHASHWLWIFFTGGLWLPGYLTLVVYRFLKSVVGTAENFAENQKLINEQLKKDAALRYDEAPITAEQAPLPPSDDDERQKNAGNSESHHWNKDSVEKKWRIGHLFLIIFGILIILSAVTHNANDSPRPSLNTQGGSKSENYAAIKRGSLICMSETQLDNQARLLGQGFKEFAPGCLVAQVDIGGKIVGGKMGVRALKADSNGRIYWVFSESVKR